MKNHEIFVKIAFFKAPKLKINSKNDIIWVHMNSWFKSGILNVKQNKTLDKLGKYQTTEVLGFQGKLKIIK